MKYPIITQFENYTISDYNNVFLIENILSDELCEEFIHLILKSKMSLSLYSEGNNVECYNTVLNDKIKVNDNYFYEFSANEDIFNKLMEKISDNNYYNNLLNGYTKEQIKKYILLLDEKIKIISDIIRKKNSGVSFKFNTGYILRKIFGPTNEHYDGIFLDKKFNETFLEQYQETREINMNTNIVRNITAIFSLNDDYEGGLFCFPEMELSIKLKKGSVIIFPPYWTHRHCTTKLLNNTIRYTITSWYGENADEKIKK
jgi:hypothetical protein